MSTSKGRTFTAPSYKDKLLLYAAEMRRENLLCDITIIAENEVFRAHKIILASSSQFFRALLSNNMQETFSREVQLPGINSSVMEALLNFIYTGNVDVTKSNVRHLLEAADFLLISSLKEICCEFLRESLSPLDCFSTAAFAKKYSCCSLAKEADKFAIEHFVEASKSSEFLSLEYCTVVKLIADNEIIVSQEEDVYKAVVRWVEHDYERRKDNFETLFKFIHLNCMSKEFLERILNEENLASCSPLCVKLLLQAIADGTPKPRNPRKTSSREITFVCCGGYKSIKERNNCIYHWTQNGLERCLCGEFYSQENVYLQEHICA